MSALTAAINILPNNYDRLAQTEPVRRKPQRFRSDHRRGRTAC